MAEQETTVVNGADDVTPEKQDSTVKENGQEPVTLGSSEEVGNGEAEKDAAPATSEAVTEGSEGPVAAKSTAADGGVVEGDKAAEQSAVAANGGDPTASAADAVDAKPAADPAPEPCPENGHGVSPETTAAAVESEPAVAAGETTSDAQPTDADPSPPAVAEAGVKDAPAPAAEEPKAEEQPTPQEEDSGSKGNGLEQQPQQELPQEQEQPQQHDVAAEEQQAPQEAGDAKVAAEEVKASSETFANGAAADADGSAPVNDISVVSPGLVQALSRRLSGTSLQGQSQPTTPPPRPASGDNATPSTATAVAAVGIPVGSGKLVKSPNPSRSGEASPPSTHDTKNTINVSQLIKMGAFKMQPLKDFVPYAELLRLRLEDGIDATRKEDYLNDADFQQVFGMDRDAFKKQPAWRQAQAKKKANLF